MPIEANNPISACCAISEIWKPVAGHDGYEVSNLGRVRSLDRIIKRRASRAQPNGAMVHLKGKPISPGVSSSGHLLVMLGRGAPRLIHRLVLEAFIGPCPDGMEALHFDDVKSHNHLGNLRWGTRSENLKDMYRNKRIKDHA